LYKESIVTAILLLPPPQSKVIQFWWKCKFKYTLPTAGFRKSNSSWPT